MNRSRERTEAGEAGEAEEAEAEAEAAEAEAEETEARTEAQAETAAEETEERTEAQAETEAEETASCAHQPFHLATRCHRRPLEATNTTRHTAMQRCRRRYRRRGGHRPIGA